MSDTAYKKATIRSKDGEVNIAAPSFWMEDGFLCYEETDERIASIDGKVGRVFVEPGAVVDFAPTKETKEEMEALFANV